jgi:lysylphosphatidylglycerol synthetase-like protein (DUF2156 family)
MKRIALILALAVACLSATSCKSPEQKRAWAQVGVTAGNIAVPIVTAGVNLATQIVVAKAQSSEDLSKKSDFFSSTASGLRSLEGSTAGVVTPGMVQNVILTSTDATKSHWNDYAAEMAKAFAASSAPTDVKLESLAVSADNTAATAKASAAVVSPAPAPQPSPSALLNTIPTTHSITAYKFRPLDARLWFDEADGGRKGLFLAAIDKLNPFSRLRL